MPKQSLNRKFSVVTRTGAALALGLLVSVSSSPGMQTAAAIGSSCNSIADCTAQINATTGKVGDLQNQAVSYKDALSRLGSNISTVKSQISDSQSTQVSLEQQIADAQKQIDNEKAVLGEDLRTMYVEGDLSTIEALATSNNLSEYVDKEEYRTSVSNSIQDTLDQITALQTKLTSQKEQVVGLLSQQRSQAAQLQSDQSHQASMLNYNISQQASYNALTAANQAKLQALIIAQRSANNSSKGGYFFLRFPGAAHGFSPSAYPYANAGFGMSTAPGCTDNDGPDRWGYCDRQCVSYAAWAVEASGRTAPKFYGNAKNWVAQARAHGIQISNTPQPGDVAISTHGTWGHAMYVESVSGNKIYVSQYNQQLTGQFSYQLRQWQ